jgi:cytoskeletal protein RodZ
MERRGANTWLVAGLAIAVGFLAALLILGGDDNDNAGATVSATTATTTQAGTTDTTSTNGTSTTSTTTATQQGTTPQTPEATEQNCINLWNQQNNRSNQTFLVNVMSQQAVRVHVGVTSDVPPQCLVTIVANDGKAYVFPEGGGSTFPYALAPGSTDSSTLPAAQKISNALEERDGTLKAR